MPERGTKSRNYYFALLCFFVALTTTDEVHNLNPILIVQHRSNPFAATHDFTIELDRNSRGRQIKLFD